MRSNECSCAICLKIFRKYWTEDSREIKNFDLLLIFFQYSISRQLIGEDSSKLTALIYLGVQDCTKLKKEVNFFHLILRNGLESSVFMFLFSSLHNPYSTRQIFFCLSLKMDLKNSCFILFARMDALCTFSISWFP